MRAQVINLLQRTVKRSLCSQTGGPKSFDEMPGPKVRHEMGTSWKFHPDMGQYSFGPLHEVYSRMRERYGDIVREIIEPGKSVVHIFDVKDIKTVYNCTNNYPYPARCSHTALAKYRKERPELYKHEGLLSSNGEEWWSLRKDVEATIFTNEDYYPVIEEAVDHLIKHINSRLDESEELDLPPLLKRWGVEVTGRITLSKSLGCLETEDPKINDVIEAAEMTHETTFLAENDVDFDFNYRRLEAAQDILSGFVRAQIEEVEKVLHLEQYKKSVLYKFLNLTDMDKRDVKMMITEMFLAGVDTVALTLSYLLHRLAQNKRVQDKLRAELVEAMPTKDTSITGRVNTYQYLTRVINEGFRLDPTAIGVGRILPKDLVLSDYLVPEGTPVIVQHQVASLLEKYCQNPLEFNPDRRFKFGIALPFGALDGRSCVGRGLAQPEVRIALAKIIRNFEVGINKYEEIGFCTRLLNFPDKPINLLFKRVY